MAARPHAIIAGAGVAGLAAACALGQRNWDVTLLERRPGLLEAGLAFLLQPNGLAALDRLGVAEEVRAAGTVLDKVVFHDRGRAGPVYDYREIGGPHGYAVEIRPEALRHALADRAASLGIEPPRFDRTVVDVARRGDRAIGVRCDNGQEVAGDLVIAADGRRSRTREALGIRMRRRGAPSAYVLATVDVPRDTRDVHVYCGDGYANGVCPLPDGTYFWDCVTDDNRTAVERRDLDSWRATYQRRVPGAAEFVDALHDWEQITELEVRPFWAASRAVDGALLVGDAAGAVHPHSAQGANLALEDAAALLDALGRDTGSSSARTELIASYARRRQRKTRRYVVWSLLVASSLDGRNPAWRLVRRHNFAAARVAPLRRLMLRGQAGLA